VSRSELRESSMAWCVRRSMSCGPRIGLPVLCGAAPWQTSGSPRSRPLVARRGAALAPAYLAMYAAAMIAVPKHAIARPSAMASAVLSSRLFGDGCGMNSPINSPKVIRQTIACSDGRQRLRLVHFCTWRILGSRANCRPEKGDHAQRHSRVEEVRRPQLVASCAQKIFLTLP
jgi:hypothetical protein